jgi:ATP synthase F1 epsilon subunit|tara:strand:- start:536 stop:931 length:396 start_codon:yes stop_codon:yes gene_type:complete
MENNFKFEIISPEKIIFSETVKMVKVPSYEGEMSILQNHISIITFLRPGIVKIEKNDGHFEELFVQDGTIEFFNNTLMLLSTSVINIKNLTKEFLENLKKETEEKLAKEGVNDQDRYILNHKIDIIKEIRI